MGDQAWYRVITLSDQLIGLDMVDEDPLVLEEILTSAKQRLDAEEITLADNEEVLHTLSELNPICERDRSYFVLGNYDREPIRRLNLVSDRHRRPATF